MHRRRCLQWTNAMLLHPLFSTDDIAPAWVPMGYTILPVADPFTTTGYSVNRHQRHFQRLQARHCRDRLRAHHNAAVAAWAVQSNPMRDKLFFSKKRQIVSTTGLHLAANPSRLQASTQLGATHTNPPTYLQWSLRYLAPPINRGAGKGVLENHNEKSVKNTLLQRRVSSRDVRAKAAG